MGNACACLGLDTKRATSIEESIADSKPQASSSLKHSTAHNDESGKDRSSIEQQIEHSKSHWSQLTESDSSQLTECDSMYDGAAEIDNVEVFKALQMHPTWGSFFCLSNAEGDVRLGDLVVGEKFAEGGQAELYEAQVKWRIPWMMENDVKLGTQYVLKVFKKGTFLRHLQQQLPQGLLQYKAEMVAASDEYRETGIMPELLRRRFYSDVVCGTLLEDGRFAFLMQKEQEDLRTHIDRHMVRVGQDRGPLSKEDTERIMYKVANGMNWLHNHNIIHRDLKASNVLFYEVGGAWSCYVSDFECSIGVIGTRFWRAPEILQACKDRTVSQRPELFTKEADIYSYGMTCYEILTGNLPLESHAANDYDFILEGHRPEIPKYVDDWARDLVIKCWQSNPQDRPSFEEVLNLIVANSIAVREHDV